MPNQLTYAFIDSQNLNLGVGKDVVFKGKTVYKGWRLDFRKFLIFLRETHKVDKAYLFIGQQPGNESLYTSLQEYGYILVFKPTLVIKKDGIEQVKGNVDAELVLHAMIHFNTYQKAVVVTGDGDFHCLVEYLANKEKLGRLIIPNKTRFSSLLSKFASHIDFVSTKRKKLAYGMAKKSNTRDRKRKEASPKHQHLG